MTVRFHCDLIPLSGEVFDGGEVEATSLGRCDPSLDSMSSVPTLQKSSVPVVPNASQDVTDHRQTIISAAEGFFRNGMKLNAGDVLSRFIYVGAIPT